MTAKTHILPKWTPLTKLHPGWSFDGQFRLPEDVPTWVEGASWPDAIPVQIVIEGAGRGKLRAQISAQIHADLPCQRCGEPIAWKHQLEQSILLVSVENEKEAEAQWEVDDDKLDWQSMLGQEISLCLPDFPRHPDCHLQGLDDSQ